MSSPRFPPNKDPMKRRSAHRSYAPPPPSLGAVQSKLTVLIYRHEQLKVSFHQLNSQIRTGLLEAEDVFTSMATQLMTLVGLKTTQMAAERRFSTVVASVDRSQCQEENYINKSMTACNELMERQRLQLMQLVSLLRKIEAQVNSSQKNIFQDLADHKASMKQFFLKAFSYVSSIHQSGQSNDLAYVMIKILKATFDQVGAAFGSVEAGIDDLIHQLADKMCNPMVEYVNGLKVEMQNGICSRLMEVVKEMDEAMRGSMVEMQVRTVELEEAQKQAKLAEQSRLEAVRRMMKSEETNKKLKITLGLLTDNTGAEQNLTEEKSLRTKEDQAKDDNLLWDLLRKKRKSQSDSPLGPNELIGMETRSRRPSSKRMTPMPSHRPMTRSQSRQPNLQFPVINSRTLLGSSPSATTQKVICGKRVTP